MVLVALGSTPWAGWADSPTECLYKVKVVSLPEHQQAGFRWRGPIRPMNDPCLQAIAIDPTNDAVWYVGGLNGLYMTRDGGRSWTHPLVAGQVLQNALVLVPSRMPKMSHRVYAGLNEKLYLTLDQGKHWKLVRTFPQRIFSVLATSNAKLYVGLAWGNHNVPNGIWVSNLDGSDAKFQSFGPGYTGLIVHTLALDARDSTLYAGTEIFDHPNPYKPPFFRSIDGGASWQNVNVAGMLPWHVIAAAARPLDGYIYALTEGSGLFGSPDKGNTWNKITPSSPGDPSSGGPTLSLLMNPKDSKTLFGGRVKSNLPSASALYDGGAFISSDSGRSFRAIGLTGASVSGLAVNGMSTRLYAAVYGSGIYVSTIPNSFPRPLPKE